MTSKMTNDPKQKKIMKKKINKLMEALASDSNKQETKLSSDSNNQETKL